MNKKISEMISDIDLELLKDIDVEEIEMIKDEEGVSLDHIKRKAMEGIQANHLEARRRKKYLTSKRVKRMILPMVAAIAALGITVVAVSSNNHLRGLFGEVFPLIEEQVQSVKTTKVANGVIFSVEEAIIDNKSGLIVVSCEKEDGTPFEEGTDFFELQASLNKRGGMGWSRQVFLSEDNRKLFAIIDLSASNKLHNNEITLTGKYLGKWRTGEVKSELNLDEMFKASSHTALEEWKSYSQEDALGKQLTEELPELILDKVTFDNDQLQIITSYQDEKGMHMIEPNIQLVDERTGEVIKPSSGSGSWSIEDSRRKMCDWFKGITEEDLPYLDMMVAYDYFDVAADGTWEVKFNLDKNKNILSIRPNIKIEKGDLIVKIKEIEVSALGVKVEGTKNTELMQGLEMQLCLEDGEKLYLSESALSTKYNRVFVYQSVVADEVDIPSEKVVQNKEEGAVASEGYDSSSYSISTKVQSTGEEGVQVPYLIDIEKVQSIIIEGIEIPLKKDK